MAYKNQKKNKEHNNELRKKKVRKKKINKGESFEEQLMALMKRAGMC